MKLPVVTVDDFIARYGNLEALELSQLDDPNAVAINRDRIDVALEDATCWFTSWLFAANVTARTLVTPSAKRVICCYARYLLDSLRRRTVVIEEYNEMIRELQFFGSQAEERSKWQGTTGRLIRIRHARAPQHTVASMQEYRMLGELDSYTPFPTPEPLESINSVVGEEPSLDQIIEAPLENF